MSQSDARRARWRADLNDYATVRPQHVHHTISKHKETP
mgnify:CR=1 FL=1